MRTFFLLILFFFSFSIFAQINPCAKTSNFHLVVLGSSTAAGSGPSRSDSAWVNRYRKYLQSINPLNQVTNLAIGGTSTYKIMPDWFIPPTGRPTTNTSNNISEAIRLNADVVIVNMPSNDAAAGYDVNEQMSNFIQLKMVADSFNVPLFICTTQPRNFSAAKKIIQIQTRDSILNYFGTRAIDFWTGFADTNNSIKSIFDSGDGVHMNDAAHNRLNKIVINLNIPNLFADTLSYTDYSILETNIDNPTLCGKLRQDYQVVYSNAGVFNSDSFKIKLSAFDSINNSQYDSVISIPIGLQACMIDTATFELKTNFKCHYKLKAFIISNDSIKQNDTSHYSIIKSIGQPILKNQSDTICINHQATFKARNKLHTDTLVWYSTQNSTQILHIGDSLPIGVLNKDSTVYVENVRGPLHFAESIITNNNSNINWNGMMFNLIAKDSIILDSLSVKLFSSGFQKVHAYYINGNYKGSENTQSNWTFWGVDSIQVNKSGDLANLNYSDLNLKPNDTLGIYLHLENSNSRLSYLSSGTTYYTGNSKLEIESGTGIGYTFGTTYNPRNFCGEIFYHYGFNPKGLCNSDRKEFKIHVNNPQFSLGNDTSISLNESLMLSAPSSSSYLWSNGSMQSQIIIDSANFKIGTHLVSLDIIDFNGCTYSDSIQITITLPTAIESNTITNLGFAPNPSKGQIDLLGNISDILSIELLDLKGSLVKSILIPRKTIHLEGIPKGLYFLRIRTRSEVFNSKLILE